MSLRSFVLIFVLSLLLAACVPQTRENLGCGSGQRCIHARILVDTPVYSNTFDWPQGQPVHEGDTLAAESEVDWVAVDDWNERYAKIIYPNPLREGEYKLGWVSISSLSAQAADGSWVNMNLFMEESRQMTNTFGFELPMQSPWDEPIP